MRAWMMSIVIVASLAACKRKPQEDPARTKLSDAKPLPDRGTAEVLPAQKVTPVGGPLVADEAHAAGAPAIELDGDGKPVVAWVEAGAVQVRRWDGAAWAVAGELASKGAQGVPVLAREADAMLLGWIEGDATRIARWQGGAWKELGPVAATAPVRDLALAWSNVGAVAVWREGAEGEPKSVHVAVHDGTAWKPLGGGVLRGKDAPPETTADVAPALATRAGGPVVVGWIEKSPAPTLHVQRWNKDTAAWEPLPVPPGADGQSTLSMTATPDGTLHAAMGYTVGLRQLASFTSGAMAWTTIGVPESANGQVLHQRITAGADGRVIFTYPFGGRYAYWDGKRWSPTSVGVMSPSAVVPAAAGAADGKVYVAWSDSAPGSQEPDRVRVFVVE